MYKGNVIEEFDEFIDPGHPCPLYDLIDRDHQRACSGAKPLVQVLKEFQAFCEERFSLPTMLPDVGFMNANYERHGLPKITQPVIDTWNLPATSIQI